MGGNALSVKTTRLSSDLYDALADLVIARLDSIFPGRRKMLIPSYFDKPDFGDMDILIAGGDGYNPHDAARELGAVEVVRNGDVTSIGLSIDQGIFQVDLIKVPPESFDFSLCYFAMNDLGNLLGRVAHKAGFKLGHLGLMYVLRDSENSDHVISELVVTQDWDEALSFLGYDSVRYRDGLSGSFRTLSDIFKFVVSGCYFSKDIYILENRNHTARVRDRKRKTYMAFLEWLHSTPCCDHILVEKCAFRQQMISRALDRFELFRESYFHATEVWKEEKMFRSIFNGRIVSDVSGFNGPDLGDLMRSIRKSFRDDADLRSLILGMDMDSIKSMIKRFALGHSSNHLEADSRDISRRY